MKVARRCGEALPKYINLMLPGVLQVSVRAWRFWSLEKHLLISPFC